MKKNEGRRDRAFRVAAGLAIVAAGSYAQSWLGLIGLIPLITGLVGYCPLYGLFGFTTCPLELRSGR